MTRIYYLFIFLISTTSFSQNPDGFDKMVQRNISGVVETIQPEDLYKRYTSSNTFSVLDSREENEYKVSHLKNAIQVGYDHFKVEKMKSIPKNRPIYIYCSVGYRSEKVGNKLLDAGYTKVYNLYGGIFNWVNNGYPIVKMNGKIAHKVHGYNKKWSKWVNSEKAQVVLN